MTAVTVVPAHKRTRIAEPKVVSVSRIALVRCRAPIAAVLIRVVQRRPIAPAGSREEYGLAVLLARKLAPFYTVLSHPLAFAVVYQLLELS